MQSIPQYGADAKLVEDFKEIPLVAGDWRSTSERSKVETTVSGLPTASVLNRIYTNSDGQHVVLTIVYASSLEDMHQPEICLMGQGWAISDPKKIKLHPKQRSSFEAMVAKLSNEVEGLDDVTVYWFDSPACKSILLPRHKIKIYLSRLTSRKTIGTALVRIMTPTAEDGERSAKAAADLANNISPYIDTMIAKPPKVETLKSSPRLD